MSISSLFDCALQAVLRDLSLHENEFPYLPGVVKTSLARVMAKRGVLTDKNVKLVCETATGIIILAHIHSII